MNYLISTDQNNWQPVNYDTLQSDIKRFADDYDGVIERLERGEIIKIIDRYYKIEPNWIKQDHSIDSYVQSLQRIA